MYYSILHPMHQPNAQQLVIYLGAACDLFQVVFLLENRRRCCSIVIYNLHAVLNSNTLVASVASTHARESGSVLACTMRHMHMRKHVCGAHLVLYARVWKKCVRARREGDLHKAGQGALRARVRYVCSAQEVRELAICYTCCCYTLVSHACTVLHTGRQRRREEREPKRRAHIDMELGHAMRSFLTRLRAQKRNAMQARQRQLTQCAECAQMRQTRASFSLATALLFFPQSPSHLAGTRWPCMFVVSGGRPNKWDRMVERGFYHCICSIVGIIRHVVAIGSIQGGRLLLLLLLLFTMLRFSAQRLLLLLAGRLGGCIGLQRRDDAS